MGGGKVRRPMQYVGQKNNVHFLETDSLRTPNGHLNFKKKICFLEINQTFYFFVTFFFIFFFKNFTYFFSKNGVFFTFFLKRKNGGKKHHFWKKNMWNFWKKNEKKKLQKNKKFDLSRENKIFFLKFKCPWGVRKLSVSKKWTFFFALHIASVYGLSPPHGNVIFLRTFCAWNFKNFCWYMTLARKVVWK